MAKKERHKETENINFVNFVKSSHEVLSFVSNPVFSMNENNFFTQTKNLRILYLCILMSLTAVVLNMVDLETKISKGLENYNLKRVPFLSGLENTI